jgi:hypothetical protein
MSKPDPPDDEPAAVDADAGLAPAAPADDGAETPPANDGLSATACTDNGGGCLIMNIALSDASDGSCIQLALDNCESAPDAGLRVSLPVSWRLGSASVSPKSDDCVPGTQFDPQKGSTIVKASGSIKWNLTTRVPSEVVLDVTLEPGSSALDPIVVANSDLVAQVVECE